MTAGSRPGAAGRKERGRGRGGGGRTSFLPSPSRAYLQPLLTPAGSDVQRSRTGLCPPTGPAAREEKLFSRGGLLGFFTGCRASSLVTFQRNPFRQRATNPVLCQCHSGANSSAGLWRLQICFIRGALSSHSPPRGGEIPCQKGRPWLGRSSLSSPRHRPMQKRRRGRGSRFKVNYSPPPLRLEVENFLGKFWEIHWGTKPVEKKQLPNFHVRGGSKRLQRKQGDASLQFLPCLARENLWGTLRRRSCAQVLLASSSLPRCILKKGPYGECYPIAHIAHRQIRHSLGLCPSRKRKKVL